MVSDQDFQNLSARVNQLDGSGLTDPNSSTVQQLQGGINGALTTIQQVSLNFQGEMTALLKPGQYPSEHPELESWCIRNFVRAEGEPFSIRLRT